MLIRGRLNNNTKTYNIDGKTMSNNSDLIIINMETIEMLQGIKSNNNSSAYYLVAYVRTGRSNFGPINITLTHPASSSLSTSNMEVMEDMKGVKMLEDYSGYWITLKNSSTNKNLDNFYRSRDTNNIYFIRRLFTIFQRNCSKFFKAIASTYTKSTNAKYSWNWLTTGDNGTGDIKNNPKSLLYNKVDNSSSYNHFVNNNGIEMVQLAYYTSKENVAIEINKIQREYSKYIRGTLSCFEPPKVYQLGADRLKVENIKTGNPSSKTMGASYRYTTSIYVSNNKVIADCGLYIDSSVWLRSGIDYDIDFPRAKINPKTGKYTGTYTLVYKFKGQYVNLGTKSVSFYWNEK